MAVKDKSGAKHRGRFGKEGPIRAAGQAAAVAGTSGVLLLALKAAVLVSPTVLPNAAGAGLNALGIPNALSAIGDTSGALAGTAPEPIVFEQASTSTPTDFGDTQPTVTRRVPTQTQTPTGSTGGSNTGGGSTGGENTGGGNTGGGNTGGGNTGGGNTGGGNTGGGNTGGGNTGGGNTGGGNTGGGNTGGGVVSDVVDDVEETLPVLAPVTSAVKPVVKTVEEVAKPVLKVVEPVTKAVEPVTKVVEPVTKTVEPVVKTVEEVAKPVTEVLEPATGVLSPVLGGGLLKR